MASRINNYQWIRQIHQYSAFTVMVFLLMYFVTGFLLVRGKWLPGEVPEPVQDSIRLSNTEMLSENELAEAIRGRMDLKGKFENAREQSDGNTRLEYRTLRTLTVVLVNAERSSAIISTRPLTIREINARFHRVHRYGKEWPYNLYLLFMDASSLALIVFVLSGLLLWLKLVKYRILGWIMLGLGLAYTLVVICTFLWW